MAKQTKAVVTTAPVAQVDLGVVFAEKRHAAAKAEGGAYGARKAYAEFLVEKLGAEFWTKGSPSYKVWQEERARYDAELKAEGHANPSMAHKRLIEAAKGPKGTGPKGKVSLGERAQVEAKALYRAFLREEEKVGLDNAEKRAFSGLITYMTDSLGLDLNTLDK